MPADLEALAKAIVLAPSVERAEALATELRRAVQAQRDARDARRSEMAEALRRLDLLPDDAPVGTVAALERAAAGVGRLDAELRDATDAVLAAAVASRECDEQAAAALVLQESLRRPGLRRRGDRSHTRSPRAAPRTSGAAAGEKYHVRLRVDPRERTVNFNVVRARGDEETAERRRLDALAEDRWCAEFPHLLRTLASRGLELDVTRRLGARDVPVQVVDGTRLPELPPDDDVHRPRTAPRLRERP